MAGDNWAVFAEEEAKKSKAYRKFFNAKRSNRKTMSTYAFCFEKFMVHLKIYHPDLDYDKLVLLEASEITEIIQDYIYDINEKMKGNSVQCYLNPVKLFFGMNDKTPNQYILRNAVKKENSVPGGTIAATDEDVQAMITVTSRPLELALIHFLSSTGMRPGAISDPVLRIKHLHQMPDDCKAIKIYDESKEGYWAFLTPEASYYLQRYLNYRKTKGELLDGESPLFRPTLNVKKRNFLTDFTTRDIMIKLIKKAGIVRVKTGNRYDKASIYMLRKRFNGKLKMENQVNSNIAEKLMAHKRGLDGTYLQPTREECFDEFKKAIPSLTVDPTERQKLELKRKQNQIEVLEEKTNRIEALEDLAVQQSMQIRDLRKVEPTSETRDLIKSLLKDKDFRKELENS